MWYNIILYRNSRGQDPEMNVNPILVNMFYHINLLGLVYGSWTSSLIQLVHPEDPTVPRCSNFDFYLCQIIQKNGIISYFLENPTINILYHQQTSTVINVSNNYDQNCSRPRTWRLKSGQHRSPWSILVSHGEPQLKMDLLRNHMQSHRRKCSHAQQQHKALFTCFSDVLGCCRNLIIAWLGKQKFRHRNATPRNSPSPSTSSMWNMLRCSKVLSSFFFRCPGLLQCSRPCIISYQFPKLWWSHMYDDHHYHHHHHNQHHRQFRSRIHNSRKLASRTSSTNSLSYSSSTAISKWNMPRCSKVLSSFFQMSWAAAMFSSPHMTKANWHRRMPWSPSSYCYTCYGGAAKIPEIRVKCG